MTETTHDEWMQSDNRVGEILQAWVARRQLGNAEPAETLISQHPQDAARLRECIESIEMLDKSGLINRTGEVVYPTIPDFEILGELGRGGMGIVYEARQLSLDRIVALKILPMTSVDPLAAQRFQREAETAAALHHTNIVPIHAVGRSEGVHWYAMQRIDGLPLDSLLRANPQGVHPDEVARIGIEAAEALALAHHHGVVHRDIKPANLLIQADGHVWLTDFGLARRDADSAATMTGAMMGTPRYMSPEQVFAPRGVSLDHRSDIYSLGATMYELVTGTALFDGTSPLDVLQQIRVADPAKPRSIRPSIPRDLEIVLQKCLAKDPKERYQSATDLANDLRAIRDGRPIKARGVPAWVVLYRRVVQHRARLKLAASAIAGTAAVIALAGLWMNHQQEIKGGQLLIDSVNGPYIASIYAMKEGGVNGDPVATTTVPMREPLRLDAGDYQISLAQHGKHSQVGIVGIHGGDTTRTRYIDRRAGTPGIRFDDHQLSIVRADDGSDLLATLNETEFAVYGRHEAFQFQLAVNAIQVADQPVDFGYSTEDEFAGNRTAMDPYYAKPRRVLASTVDLDQDALGDFVLTARIEPSIAAIKADGTVMWTTSIELPTSSLPTGRRPNPSPAVIDIVTTTDLDGDGVSDLAVTLIRNVDRSQVEAFIATVSGKSGQTIALVTLPVEKPDANRPIRTWPREGTLLHLHSNRDAREIGSIQSYNNSHYRSVTESDHPLGLLGGNFFSMTTPVPPPLHVVEFDGKPVAVRVTDRKLDAWDLRTGQQVGPTMKLPFSIAVRPVQVHSQASKSASFLIWSESNAKNPTTQTMALVVLGEESQRWTANVDFHWDVQANQLERCDFPLIADLDGDGNDEILISENKRTHWREPCRLTCYDSATGKANWTQSPTIDSLERLAERGSVMRDFDGDGVRDVAVATITARGQGNPPWRNAAGDSYSAVFVDLFSGIDGEKLCSWHSPFAAPHPLKFVLGIDRLCSDGDTQLEVSVVSGYYEVQEYEATTMHFDLSRQTPATISLGVSRLGRHDSKIESGFFLQRPGIDRYYESRVFWMDRNESVEHRHLDANQLLASWTNPNGEPRLLLHNAETFRIRAVDANSGRTLWSRTNPTGQVYASPVFDADHENASASNLLLQVLLGGKSQPEFLDGETGRLRRTLATELGLIEKAFVNNDGKSLQIYAHASYFVNAVNKRGMRLIDVATVDGAIRWDTTTLAGMYPRVFGARPLISMLRVDCNRDGIMDTIIPDDSMKKNVMALSAYSGMDGSKIWSTELGLPQERWSTEVPWPMMSLCGTKDQQRIVLLDAANANSFAVKMLATNDGAQVSQVLLPNFGKFQAEAEIGKLPGSFQMIDADPQREWPKMLIKCPNNDVGNRTWFGVQATADGLVDLTEVAKDPWNGPLNFFADVDGNGIRNRVELDQGTLTCFDNDGAPRWKREGTTLRRWKRTFESPGQPPRAIFSDKHERDLLIDLRDGRELWNRGSRIEEFRDQNWQLLDTPLINGNQLVSMTREDVTWYQLPTNEVIPENSSLTTPLFRFDSDLRKGRKLPTSPLGGNQSVSQMAAAVAESLVLSFFGVCLPIAYFYRLLRRQHTLSFLMMAPVVAIPAILVWRFVLEPTDNVNAAGRTTAMIGGTMTLLVMVLLYQVVHQKNWWVAGLIGLFTIGLTTLLIATPILVDLLSGNTQAYQWGWRDVLMIAVGCFFFVSFYGLPIWAGILYFARRRKTTQVAQTNLGGI